MDEIHVQVTYDVFGDRECCGNSGFRKVKADTIQPPSAQPFLGALTSLRKERTRMIATWISAFKIWFMYQDSGARDGFQPSRKALEPLMLYRSTKTMVMTRLMCISTLLFLNLYCDAVR